MNYAINYTGGGQPSIPVNQGQRTIVITPPSQSQQMYANSNSSGTNQFPVVIQVGSGNPPIFYTYPNSDGLGNKSVETNSSANSAINQVMISPVSPVPNSVNIHQNTSSPPNLPAMTIRTDHKSGAARSLGDYFNVQSISRIPNGGPLVQTGPVPCNVPVTQQGQHCSGQSNPDIASLLSSLQAAGVQLVEAPCGTSSNSGVGVPVVKTHMLQLADMNTENGAMAKFISSIQGSGFQVLENNVDKTLSISLPNRSMEEQSYSADQKVIPVTTNTCPPVCSSCASRKYVSSS